MHISLGQKKQSVGQIKRFEDALTSAFFGTLRYLPANLVVDLIISAIGAEHDSVNNELKKYCYPEVGMDMEFWPNLLTSGRIEPDLRIKLSHPPLATIDLLIECKWESGESSENQLLEQWKALSPLNQSRTYHVYLVKHLHEGYAVRDKNFNNKSAPSDWGSRLFVISWLDILKAIPALSTNGLDNRVAHVVKLWGIDMKAMFDRIGIHQFAGFKGFTKEIEASEGEVFWTNPFHGFQQFVNINIPNNDTSAGQSAVFFKYLNQ